MPHHTLLPLVMLGLSLSLFGCTSSKVGMSGQVIFSDDKTPLTKGTVCFESTSYVARGRLNQNGEYTLGSESEKDGLPPGRYRVYIIGASVEETPANADSDERAISIPRPLISTKYAKGATSGITLEVDASTRRFDFEVDRYKKQ